MKIVDANEDSYYGITREWCVKKVSVADIIDIADSEPDKYQKNNCYIDIYLDFGKPRPSEDRSSHRNEEYCGVSTYDIQNMVSDITHEVMRSGYRGDIFAQVLAKVRTEYEVDIMYRAFSKANDWNSHSREALHKIGDDAYYKDEDIETTEDIKPYLSEREFNVKFKLHGLSYYSLRNRYYGTDAIKWLVNKILKDEYTYCIKKGKNIVPDEYLANGDSGIKAYQAEKRGKNKNNSIEKQLVKKMKLEKKRTAFEMFNEVMRHMLNENNSRNWQEVLLAVDGRWSTARRARTVTKHIMNVSDTELLTMTDEEIEKKCKSYWVFELTQAIERIKNAKISKD